MICRQLSIRRLEARVGQLRSMSVLNWQYESGRSSNVWRCYRLSWSAATVAHAAKYSGSSRSSRSERARSGFATNGRANHGQRGCARRDQRRVSGANEAAEPHRKSGLSDEPSHRRSHSAKASAGMTVGAMKLPGQRVRLKIASPAPSPAIPDGQAAASPSSTRTGAPLRDVDLAHAIEIEIDSVAMAASNSGVSQPISPKARRTASRCSSSRSREGLEPPGSARQTNKTSVLPSRNDTRPACRPRTVCETWVSSSRCG